MSQVTNNIFARFNASTKDKKKALPLSVQKSFPVNSEIAKVIVRVPDALQNRVNEAELASAFSGIGLRYLPNSIARCHQQDTTLFAAFVSTQRKVMDGETASAGLTEVAANVFTDEQDNVWQRVKQDGRTFFVCTAGDDIAQILQGQQDTTIATASVEVASGTNIVAGDAVQFYDVAAEKAAFGIAVDSSKVYLPDADKVQEVEGTMVLAAAGGVGVSSGTGDIVEYMRKIYGHNADFYNKLRSLIQANLSV